MVVPGDVIIPQGLSTSITPGYPFIFFKTLLILLKISDIKDFNSYFIFKPQIKKISNSTISYRKI